MSPQNKYYQKTNRTSPYKVTCYLIGVAIHLFIELGDGDECVCDIGEGGGGGGRIAVGESGNWRRRRRRRRETGRRRETWKKKVHWWEKNLANKSSLPSCFSMGNVYFILMLTCQKIGS